MTRKQDPGYNGRPYRSSYYEPGYVVRDAFLEQKGFHEFPFYSPRWEVTGEDIYATECPGILALGDVRALQLEERRKAQGIDKMVSPPVHGPPSLATKPVNLLPDGGTFYDAAGSQGLKAVYEVNLRIDELRADIEAVERRIDNAFHKDLFKAITDMQGVQPRNELELAQRNQERLLELGPMIERAQTELFDRLIDRGLNQLFRAGRVRPAPEGIQGRPIKAKYVSTLAMAQQAVTTGNIDRMISLVANMASTQNPAFVRAADKVNAEQIVDEYASLIGAPPSIIRSDEEIAEKREAEDRQAQQDRQLQQAQVGADAAAKLGQIKSDSIGGQAFQQAQEAASEQ